MTVDTRTAMRIYERVTDALYVPRLYHDVWTQPMLRRRHDRIRAWMGDLLWMVAREYSSHKHRVRQWPEHRYTRRGKV